MRAHLKKIAHHLQRTSEHHGAASEHHSAMSAHLRKLGSMSKAEHGDKFAELAEAMATAHDDMSAEHSAMADDCAKCAKSMFDAFKSEGDEMGKSLMPTDVSGVAPTAPGIRAVPRDGSRPLLDSSRVPEPFRKLVAVDEDEDLPA